jgi:hypothetical protein
MTMRFASVLSSVRRRPISTFALAVLLPLLARSPAGAQCATCSGLPLLRSATMRGNDLNEVRGGCAPAGAQIEVQVAQQHIRREPICPPSCPSDNIYSYCINQCQWYTIGTTTADAHGNFTLANIDSFQSVQLIATSPSQPNGLDGVYTAIRVRAFDQHTHQWTQFTNPPFLEAFNLAWPGHEGQFAYVESRVSGASEMNTAVADGPDDGAVPSIALDVDEDTPNYWLSQSGHAYGTVEYTRFGICDQSQGCPATWLVQQAPSITVQSPPLGRGSEYPFVLGMVSAAKPGAMFIATSIMGPRGIPDIGIEVNVDVKIDIGIGFKFFSLF